MQAQSPAACIQHSISFRPPTAVLFSSMRLECFGDLWVCGNDEGQWKLGRGTTAESEAESDTSSEIGLMVEGYININRMMPLPWGVVIDSSTGLPQGMTQAEFDARMDSHGYVGTAPKKMPRSAHTASSSSAYRERSRSRRK